MENFRDDTVWCSNAVDFNDPYDSSLCFNFSQEHWNSITIQNLQNQILTGKADFFKGDKFEEINTSDSPMKKMLDLCAEDRNSAVDSEKIPIIHKMLTEFIDKQIREMNERINHKIKRGYKICSFSEKLESMLMWSHYSDNHTGFVIEYNFHDLSITDLRSRFLWPVIYQDNVYNISQFFEESMKKGDFNNLFGIIAAIHKAKDWEYEKEWRMIIPLSPSDPPTLYNVPVPQAVYLGAQMKEEQKQNIINIANIKNIPIYQMALAHSEFKMIPEKIN